MRPDLLFLSFLSAFSLPIMLYRSGNTSHLVIGFLVPTLLLAEGVESQDAKTVAFTEVLPDELQFSDAIAFHEVEAALAKKLAVGDSTEQLSAARALWEGHSRKSAANVVRFAVGPPPGGNAFRAFQREVEAALQPDAILREIDGGDYRWGTWLAFLRPHKELVPTLLAGLRDKRQWRPETVLALGNCGDPRALEPLVTLLKSGGYRTPGDAAQALGYLGLPEAEPSLVEALAKENPWLRVKACDALAKIGTHRAVPAMERLAKDNRYTGLLDVKGMAEYAIERIAKRQR
jgi:hypothetical protein